MNRHTDGRRYVKLIMTFTAGLWLLASPLLAQTSTGSIYGKVLDSSNATLPGVTVTANASGAQHTFVTEADGAFRFLRLPPGRYTVQAELAGLGTVRRAVDVNIGSNTAVEIQITPSMTETLTVTAATPLIDARDTSTGEVVTLEEIENLPTARDPWVMLQQMPGVLVDRVNVGGNKSGQQSYFVSKGVERHQTSWNIDGVNVTEMDELGTTTFYYDFGSLQEFQVVTSTADPSVRTPGVQINMVTKRGSNDWAGSARMVWADEEFQAEATVPSSIREGNRVDNVTEWGAEFSGPIIRDRLWGYGAYGQNKISNITFNYSFPQRTNLENITAKLNAQPLANNDATLYYMFSDKTVNARDLSSTRPPETARRQSGPGDVLKFEDTHVFSNNFVMTGLLAKVASGYLQEPRGGMDTEPYWVNTQGLNGENRGWHNTYRRSEQSVDQMNYRADASWFRPMFGLDHEVKFGLGYRDQDTEWSVVYPGNQTWGEFYRNPADNLAAFTREAHPLYVGEYNDFYVGDTVAMGDFTIQGGARYDLQRSFNKASSVRANPLIPNIFVATSYDGDDRKLEWESITPKLGVTWSPGSKRTVLKTSYSRYVDQLAASDSGANNPFYDYQILYYPWADANGDKRVQVGEADLANLYFAVGVDPDNLAGGAPSVGRIDYDNHDPTTTDEYILGVEHELVPGWAVGASYTHRLRDNFIWNQYEKTRGSGNFFTAADYVLGGNITGSLADGTPYSVPYYRLKPGVPRPTFYATRNRPDYSQTYQGLELTATKRMTGRWSMRGQVTLADWTQSVGARAIQNPSGLLEGDGCYTCDGSAVGSSSGSDGYINARWTYSLSGIYQAPWQINLGAVLQGREGYINGYNVRTASNVDGTRRRYVVNEFEDFRFDNLMQLDLRLAKEFRLPAGIGFEIAVDAFNVTNERTILWRDYEIIPVANAPSAETPIQEMQSPRLFRLGGKISF
ncbi:MAG: TonB-dependent receptor [Thermoanaerobaculia bacterium]|nr:TonB-dependent receptor [Thermoanaerobaculia bacterium]